MAGFIAGLIRHTDTYLQTQALTQARLNAALVRADTEELFIDYADRIVERLSRKLNRLQGAIMADLSALEAQVTSVSDNAAALSGVVDEVLAKIADLGVNDAELDAMTERLRTASASLDEDTTQLASAVAPAEQPPADGPPADEPPVVEEQTDPEQ
jgi:predicted ATP-grasp superfamily ATP-dependent carboligase